MTAQRRLLTCLRQRCANFLMQVYAPQRRCASAPTLGKIDVCVARKMQKLAQRRSGVGMKWVMSKSSRNVSANLALRFLEVV